MDEELKKYIRSRDIDFIYLKILIFIHICMYIWFTCHKTNMFVLAGGEVGETPPRTNYNLRGHRSEVSSGFF